MISKGLLDWFEINSQTHEVFFILLVKLLEQQLSCGVDVVDFLSIVGLWSTTDFKGLDHFIFLLEIFLQSLQMIFQLFN